MKRLFVIITAFMATLAVNAVDDNTVEVVYNGSSATVTVASNISSYITNQSNGSHVKLIQSKNVNDKVGEITYNLSGTSTDGEFYLEGSYKATVEFSGLTLTNPSGPAVNIQDGKRVAISAKKDGIHCKQYFLMKSGTVNISGAGDDGIQVELKEDTPTAATADHEDEDTGNFYMEDGELTISACGGKAIKADGSVNISGGTQNYDKSAVVEYALGISNIVVDDLGGSDAVYDLNGRQLPDGKSLSRGVYIIRKGNQVKKAIFR